MKNGCCQLAAIVACWTGLTTAFAEAADPDPLLRLVGDRVGVCLRISQLDRELARLAEDASYHRLRRSDLARQWLAGREYAKFHHAQTSIERLTGQPLTKQLRGLFGQSVIVAVYLQPGSEPAGVLLTRASSAASLDEAIAAWNRAEPQQETTSLTHSSGTVYYQRVKPGRRGELYYARFGEVLALSDKEAMVNEVIERQLGASQEDATLARSETYRQATQSLAAGTPISIFLNPRSWDHVLERSAEQGDGPPLPMEVWKRCRSLIAGVRIEQGLLVELIADYDADSLPAGWTEFLNKSRGDPEFFNHVPPDALVAWSGRQDWGGLGNLLLRLVPERDREGFDRFRQISRGLLLGRGPFTDVLPAFNPGWGGYLLPRASSQRQPFPVEGLAGFRLPVARREDVNSRLTSAELADAIDNALNAGLNLLALTHNEKHPADDPAFVRTERGTESVTRWVAGLPGIEPAYALDETHFLVATRPKFIRDFRQRARQDSLAVSPAFANWKNALFSQANQVVYANTSLLREELLRRRDSFASADDEDGVDRRPQRQLERIAAVLQLADAAVVAARIDAGRIRILAACLINQPTVSPVR